jgi:hypothetical protein|tara:strand:+ start:941 stop:1261 length:321 start_codon:yes stop_codon:yes gene_type:complete
MVIGSGTPIRLKVEDANDPTYTCETETQTTVTEEWEVLVLDFVDEAPVTEFLSIGLERGWIYNMISIFLILEPRVLQPGQRSIILMRLGRVIRWVELLIMKRPFCI